VTVQIDDYERLVVDRLARREVELAIGDGRGVLLGHEAGEGTLEVFRLGERDLLALIASYADEPDFETMAREAAATEPSPMAILVVDSGELVWLRSAASWPEARVVTEAANTAPPRDWGPVDTDALVVHLPIAAYAVGEIRVDRERYGLDAWRITDGATSRRPNAG
jgi:hypothetical protein